MLERTRIRLSHKIKELSGRKSRRVVFLHIPKCGGTSVNYHFKSNFGSTRSGASMMINSTKRTAHDPAWLARAKAAQFVGGHHGWNALDAVSAGAFRFTVMREPFARLKSLYLFSRARCSGDDPVFDTLFDLAKQMSFGDFCLSRDPDVRAMVDNVQTRTLADDFFPYFEWDKVKSLRLATQHLQSLDFVIDAHDLSDGLARLAALTGTVQLTSQAVLNRTPTSDISTMSRREFLSDPQLHALVAQDSVLYEHACERSATPAQAPESAREYVLA